MTSLALAPTEPEVADDWGGRLFFSSQGLFPFQADDLATTYLNLQEHSSKAALVLWQTGTGKTIYSMALSALMFEDDLIDQVLVIAEANKVTDWAKEDFPRFTRLSVLPYKGSPQRRANILRDAPQVLVSTYETVRNDVGTFAKKARTPKQDGILTDFLRGKRTLVVLDEVSKLGNRTSALYKSYEYLFKELHRDRSSTLYLVGLTATSVERNAETHFNASRILAPLLSPGIGQFRDTYIRSYNQFGDPVSFRNLSPKNCEPGVVPLSQVYQEITYRRRKTDPDIMAQFPAKMENPYRYVTLGNTHRQFYDAIQDIVAEMDDEQQRAQFSLLRQIAGHPVSLLTSQGKMAQEIVAEVGANGLRQMGSAKTEEMVDWARLNREQQMVIFTFFGQSVLPLIHDRLTDEGYSVTINHGQMSAAERQEAQNAFKSGEKQIFLTSDAGARGLNLGCGSALLHYELPSKMSTYIQRSDRIHRISSVHPSITIDSLVAANTVEEGMAGLLSQRDRQSEQVMADDLEESGDVVSAADRHRLLTMMRRVS